MADIYINSFKVTVIWKIANTYKITKSIIELLNDNRSHETSIQYNAITKPFKKITECHTEHREYNKKKGDPLSISSVM